MNRLLDWMMYTTIAMLLAAVIVGAYCPAKVALGLPTKHCTRR